MTHAGLVILAERYLLRQGCRVVLTERGRAGEEFPDAIGWMPDGTSILIEAKRTRKDFLAEWSRADRKQHRRNHQAGMGERRYYLGPAGIIRPDDLEGNGWGLIEAWPRRLFKRVDSVHFQPDRYAELRLIVASFSKVERDKNNRQQQFAF